MEPRYQQWLNSAFGALGIDPADFLGADADKQFAGEAARAEHYQRGTKPNQGTSNLLGQDVKVSSSNVFAVRYDPAQGTLFVAFDNRREQFGPRLYAYDITLGEDIWEELISTSSPGRVVWDRLRRAGAPFSRLM